MLARPHPRSLSFGRRRPFATQAAALPAPAPAALGDELQLFAVTWLGGFLVASIFFA